jgi:hypothetical protein
MFSPGRIAPEWAAHITAAPASIPNCLPIIVEQPRFPEDR